MCLPQIHLDKVVVGAGDDMAPSPVKGNAVYCEMVPAQSALVAQLLYITAWRQDAPCIPSC